MQIKIGADPEFFLRRHGELVSAHGMVPGTKAYPHEVEGGAIQVDGMALEFNINPATETDEFVDNIQTVLRSFREFLPEKDGWEFDFSPVAEFGSELINAQPYEARILGCEPDFSAYTGLPNPKPNADMPFRTASGHIHIGWTEDEDALDPEHVEACRMLTKQLDLSLAPFFRFFDEDTKRRELYGQLGAYRPKKYGVEYRVLSNHWLTSSDLMGAAFDITMEATNKLLDGYAIYRDYPNTSFVFGESLDDIYSAYERADNSLLGGSNYIKYHNSSLRTELHNRFEDMKLNLKKSKVKNEAMFIIDDLAELVEQEIRPWARANPVLDIDAVPAPQWVWGVDGPVALGE